MSIFMHPQPAPPLSCWPRQDTWRWTQIEPQGPERPAKRDMASLTSLGAGRLLLFGGRTENGRVSGECWLFDIAM